jgi:hypothetical protein
MAQQGNGPFRLGLAIVFGAAIALFTPPASADDISFKGKTINIIVNSNPGGGTDGAARLVGTYLSKYLPGSPPVLYRNLPGGSGIKANNYFYERVEPDGLTLLGGSREQLSPTKLLNEASKYNPAKYAFIGGFARASSPIVIRVKDKGRLMDPKTKPLVFGDPSGERTAAHAALWGKEFLGWNVRFVLGYASSAAAVMAFRSGETDMASSFLLEPYMKSDGLEVIADLGMQSEDGSKILPHPQFPGTPLFDEMIRPKLNPEALKAYEIWLADQVVDKWIALPPKTSDAFAGAYRKAFDELVKDPKFIESATDLFDKDFVSLSAARLKELVDAQVATTKADLVFLDNLRRKNGLPVLDR